MTEAAADVAKSAPHRASGEITVSRAAVALMLERSLGRRLFSRNLFSYGLIFNIQAAFVYIATKFLEDYTDTICPPREFFLIEGGSESILQAVTAIPAWRNCSAIASSDSSVATSQPM